MESRDHKPHDTLLYEPFEGKLAKAIAEARDRVKAMDAIDVEHGNIPESQHPVYMQLRTILQAMNTGMSAYPKGTPSKTQWECLFDAAAMIQAMERRAWVMGSAERRTLER